MRILSLAISILIFFSFPLFSPAADNNAVRLKIVAIDHEVEDTLEFLDVNHVTVFNYTDSFGKKTQKKLKKSDINVMKNQYPFSTAQEIANCKYNFIMVTFYNKHAQIVNTGKACYGGKTSTSEKWTTVVKELIAMAKS